MFVEGLKSPRKGNYWQTQHPQSSVLDAERHAGGQYVYVVNADRKVVVAPDGPHRHPEVLGHGEPGYYAGEIALDPRGTVTELNNLSGTFCFQSPIGLLCVVEQLQLSGIEIAPEAASFYDPAGVAPVIRIAIP